MSEYDELIEDVGGSGEEKRRSDESSLVSHDRPVAASLPALTTAADLLPPEEDPLASLPREPADADTPPDEAVPAFLVRKNRFGPGAHSVLLSDGTPVGVWLNEQHHDLQGEEVSELLLLMGLEPDLAAWFGKLRAMRHEAEGTLLQNPAIQTVLAAEAERVGHKEQVRAAFLAAQKRKQP